jgi:hypothetical protein
MTDTTKPGPCPFCGGAMHVRSNRDWHRIIGEHSEECFFDSERQQMMVPATDVDLAEMIAAWNRRPSPSVHRQASAGKEGVTDENIRSLWQTTDTGDVETDIMSFARSLLALPNHWRSALEFYADHSNWTSCSAMERGPCVDEDGGDMARAVLSTAAPESKETDGDGWLLDSEGRRLVGTSHHYTAANVKALIWELKALEDPRMTTQADFENRDWRAWCGALHRILSGLASEVPLAPDSADARRIVDADLDGGD